MFYDVFDSLCRINDTSPFAVAIKLGFSRSTPAYWKRSGNPPKREALEKIAEYFHVTPDYLLGKDEPPSQSNISDIYTENIYSVPVYESVSAGFGAYADNHIVDYMPIMIKSSTEAGETICIRVSGDSMSPLIEDGDIIQVRKQESVDSGDIAVVLLDGEEGLVKKVVYGAEYIDLISVNETYRTRHFEGEDVLRLRVVGKVRRVIRDL